jgi:hypothetical protein
LADELGRFPLEQSGTNGLRYNNEAGLVNHHGEPTQLKLGRGGAGWLAGSSGVGRWVREGRQGAGGSLVLAYSIHKVATHSLAANQILAHTSGSGQ